MQALKSLFVMLLGAISALYLMNVGWGVVEFVPDNLPFVGNLDEATATFLLLNCLAYFGINIGPLRKLLPADKRLKSDQPETRADRK
ncbi:MAG: DUF1232 domain-containing protein [Planctomycetaceae bacterium]|nr:DUF1232 domain-containing protein [Planctomycetaceae bacterium]